MSNPFFFLGHSKLSLQFVIWLEFIGENGRYLGCDENQNLILRYGRCLHACHHKGECKHPCCKLGIKNNRRKADDCNIDEREKKRQKSTQIVNSGKLLTWKKRLCITINVDLKPTKIEDHLISLREKATHLSTKSCMKLLKDDSISKELTSEKNAQPNPQQVVKNKYCTIIEETQEKGNNTTQCTIFQEPQQGETRTFKFLGKDITLPSITPERNFFALQWLGRSNNRGEFEFRL